MSLNFFQPKSIAEAVQVFASEGEDGKALAGGTDLVLHMQEGKLAPKYLVDLSKISALRFIEEKDGFIRIGSMTTFTDLAEAQALRKKVTALAEAASMVGSPQIRNQGTVGGNIANASPAADTVPPLVALDAKLKIYSSQGQREVNISEIFAGAGKNLLNFGEIIGEISFSIPDINSVSSFYKLAKRKALSISRISSAVFLEFKPDSFEITKAQVGLGSIASNPIKASATEEFLVGRILEDAVISEAVRKASEEAAITLGVRPSAVYKKDAIGGVIRGALAHCRLAWQTKLGRER